MSELRELAEQFVGKYRRMLNTPEFTNTEKIVAGLLEQHFAPLVRPPSTSEGATSQAWKHCDFCRMPAQFSPADDRGMHQSGITGAYFSCPYAHPSEQPAGAGATDGPTGEDILNSFRLHIEDYPNWACEGECKYGQILKVFAAKVQATPVPVSTAPDDPAGAGALPNYEHLYNEVMGLLRNTKMPHGLCEPRGRKACTHCNAVQKLDELLANYKGARVVVAARPSEPPAGAGVARERVERLIEALKYYASHADGGTGRAEEALKEFESHKEWPVPAPTTVLECLSLAVQWNDEYMRINNLYGKVHWVEWARDLLAARATPVSTAAHELDPDKRHEYMEPDDSVQREYFKRGREWKIAEYKRHLVEHNPQIANLCSWCRLEVEWGRARTPVSTEEGRLRETLGKLVDRWDNEWPYKGDVPTDPSYAQITRQVKCAQELRAALAPAVAETQANEAGIAEGMRMCAEFLEREADANFMPNEPTKVLIKGLATAIRVNRKAFAIGAVAETQPVCRHCGLPKARHYDTKAYCGAGWGLSEKTFEPVAETQEGES